MIKTDRSADLGQYRGGGPSRLPAIGDSLLAWCVRLAFDAHVAVPAEDLIAERVGYSASQVRRLFWMQAGETPASFVRRLRLERAAGMLTLADGSVSHIAAAVGFEASESFSKAFRARFDCSPRAFRELNSTPDRLLPGYILWRHRHDSLPKRVRLRVTFDQWVAYLYDGPILVARMLPDGRIDWRP